jgi:hypothetical protein
MQIEFIEQPKTRVSLMRKAIRLFNSEYVPREVNRANRIAWLCAVQKLGEKWVAIPANRRA